MTPLVGKTFMILILCFENNCLPFKRKGVPSYKWVDTNLNKTEC